MSATKADSESTVIEDSVSGAPNAAGLANSAPNQRMQCMELWGGNTATDSTFDMPGLSIRVFAEPHAEAKAGGDVYYLSSCASGRISRLLLADVCGHGLEASATAKSLRQLMRRNVNYINQNRLVSGLNEQFGKLSNNGGFATALIATFFSPTRKLTLCNAGHPPPLVYRAASGAWSVHAGDPGSQPVRNLPLGLTEGSDFNQFQAKLNRGDLVLCYTDALFEVKTEDGQLGADGLARILNQIDCTQPESIIANLRQALADVSPTALADDDVTIILIESTVTRTRLRDNIAAPFRFVRSLLQKSDA